MHMALGIKSTGSNSSQRMRTSFTGENPKLVCDHLIKQTSEICDINVLPLTKEAFQDEEISPLFTNKMKLGEI